MSLSADGTVVAIGATHNDANDIAGHVRVYEYASDSWSQLGDDIDGEAENDASGHSVSLSADGARVAIGAPTKTLETDYAAGQARVYEYTSGSWTQLPIGDIDGEDYGDFFGYSVSLSANGSTVAVGAPWANYGDYGGGGDGLSDNGHVRVFNVDAL